MSCAQLTHAREVRLGEKPSDFRLRCGDHERAFEIVDGWSVGRRVGDEYHDLAHRWNADEPLPVADVHHTIFPDRIGRWSFD